MQDGALILGGCILSFITLTDTLNLDSVLAIPSLDYNLLSVSQSTAALSCIVIFLPEFCVIEDI